MTLSLIGAISSLIVTVLQTVGLPGLLALMVVESFGFPPIPSEVILPFTGFLVYDGTFSFGAAGTVAVLGGLIGSYAAYAVGRWWRHRLTGLGIGHLRLEARHLDRIDRYFARHGESTVGLARLVPVIRGYVSYPAGTARMDPVRFGVYTVLGSIPFTLSLIYAGMLLRSQWTVVSDYLRYLDYPLIALVVVVVGFLLLQVVGVLEPGWPPHRARRSNAPAPEGPGAPPPSVP